MEEKVGLVMPPLSQQAASRIWTDFRVLCAYRMPFFIGGELAGIFERGGGGQAARDRSILNCGQEPNGSAYLHAMLVGGNPPA
jgi:hypothetical protein